MNQEKPPRKINYVLGVLVWVLISTTLAWIIIELVLKLPVRAQDWVAPFVAPVVILGSLVAMAFHERNRIAYRNQNPKSLACSVEMQVKDPAEIEDVIRMAFERAESYMLRRELGHVEFVLIFPSEQSCRFQLKSDKGDHSYIINSLQEWLGPLIENKWIDIRRD